MPSLLVMQWLIVGFFVFIHFLLGMIRGTSKSAWYLLAYIITAILTFLLIANFSLTWFYTTQESMVGLIEWANGLAGGVLNDYMDYISDPAITPVVFMVLDLIIKIVLYQILFPFVRWLLTLIIFRPIWKRVILKQLLQKQNETLRQQFEEQNDGRKKYKNRKKLKINFMSRLSGGFLGAVRGFLVAFVFLLPILVMSSFIGKLDVEALNGNVSQSGQVELAAGAMSDPLIPDEFLTYLDQVDEMNEEGFSQITNAVTVNGITFDRYVFDAMFTPIINDDSVEQKSVNFIQELENVFDITAIIINNGYHEQNYQDLSWIEDEDIDNAQLIIQTIGKSDLLSYILSSGLDKAPDLIPELVTSGPLADIDWTSDSLQATLDYLADTNWQEEFNRIAAVVDALNDFMSPSDILLMLEDPSQLAQLNATEITALTNVIRAMGDLHLLAGINLGLEYAITLPEIQDQIAWSQEPDVYLREKLSFILDHPDFFIGENGEIDKIAELIEIVLTDETSDLEAILNSGGDLEVILKSQSDTLVQAIFTQLASMDLIVETLPIAVDFALYEVGGDQIAGELAGDLATALDDIDWSDEITNIGDVYVDALSLGLETVFADNPDYLAYADQIITNPVNMGYLRAIVSGIFEDSQLVSEALDIAAPYIIDQMITNEDLKEIIEQVVLDENDDFDFNIGQEINNVLVMAEELSTVTTFSNIGNFGSLDLDGKLALIADFGSMPQTNYATFRTALTSLQILSKIDETVASDIVSYLGFEDTVYIPTEMLLSEDMGAIMDLTRDVAQYFYTESVGYSSYDTIDVTDLLDILKTDLLDDEARSDLVFYNMVYQLQKLADEGTLSAYLTIPDTLPTNDPEDPQWDDELNYLLGAVFDIATSVGSVDGVTLSVGSIQSYIEVASGLPIEIITQYADEQKAIDAFSGLDQSQILRASIKTLIDGQGESLQDTLFGHIIETPSHLVDENGLLETSIFKDLIHGAAVLLDDMNQTLSFTTIGDLRGNDVSTFIQAFNQVDDTSIEAFVSSDLIHGVVSDLLTDTTFQEGLVDTLNQAQQTLTFESDLFAVDDDLLDPAFTNKDVLKDNEVANVLFMLKALQLQDLSVEAIGLETFTEMVDRNVDAETGTDDLDRFFKSSYMYTIIDRVLQMDSISTFVAEQLGSSLGVDMSGLDLTLPNEMLGQQADADLDVIEPIEVNRIPKAEFRRIFTSLSLIDMDDLGISTFTTLVDPTQDPDDFSTFIASDFIYFVLASLFDNAGFGDYVATQLGSSFGDTFTLDVSVPTDAKGTQVEADANTISLIEVGRMKRDELRNIMISFSMLDIENAFSVGSMLDLFVSHDYIAEDVDPQEDRDNDFYQFVDSIYLQALVSQILLSDTIIDTIAGTDSATPLFDADDFAIPAPGLLATQPDGYPRLTKDEIYYMFNGLNALDITDFENIDLGLDVIRTVDEEVLLKSNYLYEVLDLSITNQSSLTIPVDAYETSGVYDTMITKDEISRLFTALSSLSNVDPAELDMSELSQAEILTIIDSESVIINQMTSDQVETALASVVVIDNTVLPEAYETITGVDRLLVDELKALVVSMETLGLTDLSNTGGASFAVDNIGVAALQDIHDLGLGDGLVDTENYDFDSYILHYLITDQIESALAISALTVPEAYTNATGHDRLKADEIQALIVTMDTISLSDLSGGISVSDIGQSEMLVIHNLGLGDELVGTENYDIDSYIVHKLISEQIETALSVSQVSLPEAYDQHPTTNNYWMKADEVEALIVAMGDDALDIDDFNAAVSASTIGQTQLLNLHNLGLGDGLVGTENYDFDSYIIHQLLTEQLETALSVSQVSLPEAYDQHPTTNNYWMKADEVEALIIAMDAIGITDFNNAVSVAAVDLSNLQDLHDLGLGDGLVGTNNVDLDSYIIHDLLTTQIETILSVNNTSVPEAYTNATGNSRMEADEIQALLEAMDPSVLNISDLSSGFDLDVITVARLRELNYIGLGDSTNHIESPYDSYLIHNLLSDNLSSTLDEPSTAHIDDDYAKYMLADEVTDVIEAMAIINGDNQPLNAFGTISNNLFTTSTLGQLIALDSLTVYRLISTGMISSSVATLESYADPGDSTYDPQNVGDDLKEEEIVGVYETMSILGLNNITEISSLTVAQVTGKTDAEIDTMFDNSNTIVYFIIDDLVDPNETNILFVQPRWNDESGEPRVDRTELITYLKNAE